MPMTHWTVALPLAVVLALLGGLSLRTALGGRAGTLPRDGRLGVRSPASTASDAAFIAANRVAAPIVGAAAVVALGCAAVLAFAPLPVLSVLLVFVLGALGAVVLLVQAGKAGEQVARRMPIPARRPGGASCSGCACGGGGCAALTRNAPEAGQA